MALNAGTRLGPYEVLAPLGFGGMGEVYRARDTRLDRSVALKLLRPHLTGDARATERFLQEAKVASALDHPNICTIHEIGETADGQLYLVMPHYEGETLKRRIERGPLPQEEALDIALQIARGLEKAHAADIVHRDINPANVMITSDGLVKILDFGLAKLAHQAGLTQTGTILGTASYMSPEQAGGWDVDQRTDIWSLGVVLYEMLAGRPPFPDENAQAAIYAILHTEPKPLSSAHGPLPAELTGVVGRALAKDPAHRYQSVAELRTDLRRLSEQLAGLRTMREPAPASGSVGVTRQTRFVGRQAERAHLRRLLDQALDGRGTLVLVGGEPGVGKTRVTEELLVEARARGCLALVGHCYEMQGAPPFVPFVEMLERTVRVVPRTVLRAALGDAAPEIAKLMPELRRVFADIPPPLELPPEQQRRFLFNAYQEFVERATRVSPIVAVLEDLHWADDSTLHLLHHLAPQLGGMALLVVGTYRDVELDVARPFAAVLESLLRQRLASRLPLKPLPQSDVAAMLGGLSGEPAPDAVVAAVYQETEGNPFFVEEVFQHLSEQGQVFDTEGHWRPDLRLDELQVPEGVRLVIGRRLERLGEEARRALTTGAMIGRSFDLGVLEAAGDVKGEALLNALEEAERAQLIAVAPGARVVRYKFAHELIRQTLVGAVSLPRRQRLHLRIAGALEAVHAGALEPHAATLAHHLYQAGAAADAKKAVRYLTLAGDRAAAAAAFDEALREYETALLLPEGNDERQRADLLVKRGVALRSLGRGAEAIKDWQDALPIYEASGDGEAVARLCRDLAYQLRAEARYADAADIGRRGLRCVGAGVTGARCRLLAAAGLGQAATGDYDGGAPLLDQAQTIAEQLADPQLLGQVLSSQAIRHYYYGAFTRVASVGLRGAETLRRVGDLWELALVLGFVQVDLVFSGRFEQAASVDQELRPLAVRLGHQIPLLLSDIARAYQALALTGELDAFEDAGRRGIDDWRRAGPWSWLGHYLLAVAKFCRGRWPEALQSLEQAIGLEPARVFSGWVWGSVFLVKAYAAQPDALESYGERRADLPAPGRPAFFGDWCHLSLAVEGLAVLGERERAYELYAAVLQLLENGMVLGVGFQLAQTAAGIAAACGSDWERAEAHHQAALRQAHDLPHKLARPEARRWYAQMLIDRNGPGDRDRARTLLAEAIEMYRTIGMPKHLEMAERMLERL